MTATTPAYFREEQAWRTSPPILVITIIGTVAAWALFIWVELLGRPLGQASVPGWLAWTILAIGGILFPFLVLTLKQTVEVHPDHVFVQTSPLSRYRIQLNDVVRVEALLKAALAEYTNRAIGSGEGTRTAYTVMGDKGVELERADGSRVLLGSEQPEALAAAITTVWEQVRR